MVNVITLYFLKGNPECLKLYFPYFKRKFVVYTMLTKATPSVKILPSLLSQSARKVAALVQEGKGKFLLKISLDPFTEKDVKVSTNQGAVHVTGTRGESTGVSNWSHHLDMEFPLPNNVKQSTVVTKFENETVVIVTADTDV